MEHIIICRCSRSRHSAEQRRQSWPRSTYAGFASGVGLAYNEILQNSDVQAGVARALGHPGPTLTRVAISYEGREIRWLNAAKGAFIKRLPGDAKVRMASRIAGRSIKGHPQND